MTKDIKTSIKIEASRDQVWEVLMDFEKYPEWNTFITFISGSPKIKEKLKISVQGMNFKPLVLLCKERVAFKWLGHLWIKGLFDGEHQFYLTENADGTTNFEHSEKFSGFLVKLLAKNIDQKIKEGFGQMNRELKERVEKMNDNI